MSIPKALERIGGIQAQYAPAMYIGLWSRLEGLERTALTRALERRIGDPGDGDAGDDPPRLEGGLLAAHGCGPAAARGVVGARQQG